MATKAPEPVVILPLNADSRYVATDLVVPALYELGISNIHYEFPEDEDISEEGEEKWLCLIISQGNANPLKQFPLATRFWVRPDHVLAVILPGCNAEVMQEQIPDLRHVAINPEKESEASNLLQGFFKRTVLEKSPITQEMPNALRQSAGGKEPGGRFRLH